VRYLLLVQRRIVYLARHGETDWNKAGRWQGHTDVSLNEAGRLQAHALGQSVLARGIVQVHASDLARAKETGEIVARLLGVPAATPDPALRERGFGAFAGLTREECELRFPDEWQRYRAGDGSSPPGGEPRQQVVERMRAGLQAMVADGLDGPRLAVSHGGAMRLLVMSITGEMPPPLENGAVFRIDVRGDALVHAERIK
jgi:broad specificity phosphatase PhoE